MSLSLALPRPINPRILRLLNALYTLLRAGIGLGVLWMLATGSPPVPVLEQIQRTGVLRVASVNGPTTVFEGSSGERDGFEYDLAKQFADDLGVRLNMIALPDVEAVLDAVRLGRVHIAAASITATDERARTLRLSSELREVHTQLAYRQGSWKPRNLDTIRSPVTVVAGSSQATLMESIAAEKPNIRLHQHAVADVEELLEAVANGEIDHVAADSDRIAIARRYYPKLAVALDLSDSQSKVWAFQRSTDTSLYDSTQEWLRYMIAEKELQRINDRHFGHIGRLDFVSSRTLGEHIETRLPRYRELFERYGTEVGLDWRLLATVSYQESHWNRRARSPTGVRGLMMLTLTTAQEMGVANRLDPEQSIRGGARYIRKLLDRLPQRIPEPDRLWMGLAAYNMGIGHLRDARKLTEMRNGDPDRWVDVRDNLHLLTQRKWYSQLRHGYARGGEARTYVGNIRAYYDILVWVTTRDETGTPVPQPPDETEARPDPNNPLDLELPVL